MYTKGSEISNADSLSHPRPVNSIITRYSRVPSEYVIYLNTYQDKILSGVLANIMYVTNGWPTTVELTLRTYGFKKYKLSSLNSCMLLGNRIIMPTVEHMRILDNLH